MISNITAQMSPEDVTMSLGFMTADVMKCFSLYIVLYEGYSMHCADTHDVFLLQAGGLKLCKNVNF